MLFDAVDCIYQYARIYTESEAFIEIFSPLLSLLNVFVESSTLEDTNNSSSPLIEKRDLINGLMESSKLKRKALQLLKRKPVAIATYVPKFQEQLRLLYYIIF